MPSSNFARQIPRIAIAASVEDFKNALCFSTPIHTPCSSFDFLTNVNKKILSKYFALKNDKVARGKLDKYY